MEDHGVTGGKFFCIFFFLFGGLLLGAESAVWKNAHLLDPQTQEELKSYEKFFDSLFQLPAEYNGSPEKSRKQMAAAWIKQLQSQNCEESIAAAAWLGMIRFPMAAGPVERVLVTGQCGGRQRWVCARSLGQIGNKSSIPVLIDLLDNQNANTRVYARAGLAEMAGVYFGDDKEKWKAWQQGEEMPQFCTAEECEAPQSVKKMVESQKASSEETVSFRLADVYGRIVDAEDYKGLPVLYIFGSCWCGGCQQDITPFCEFVGPYASRGLQAVRVVAGDNELSALDFQKHYRMDFVQLMDSNRTFEKRHNRDGWTFLMLADPQGRVVYKAHNPRSGDYDKVRTLLDPIVSGSLDAKQIRRNGIGYRPATLERSGEKDKARSWEVFPSIACGSNGKVYMVFTSVRDGSSDILFREYDGQTWSEDIPIAATGAEEYDAMILSDSKGLLWVCWTAGTAGRYDIYMTSFADPRKVDPPMQVTHSDDDAMHARMACDREGNIWVTCYKWLRYQGRSRDREVYIRRIKQGQWSDEIQVSPADVPWHEDHTDPCITPYGNGVLVAWSWDFHPPNKGYSASAELPTIFMRPLNETMQPGPVSSVSSRDIDMTPAILAMKDRTILCAWDGMDPQRQRHLYAGFPLTGQDLNPGKIESVCRAANVCTPCLAMAPGGGVSFLWSQKTQQDSWVLSESLYDPSAKIRKETRILVQENNPRFACGAYDAKGKLWVAYSSETEKGRHIVVNAY